MLTQERLKELYSYDPLTGEFTRLFFVRGARTGPGLVKSTPNFQGYLRIRIDGVLHFCHRLAWLYTHGEWPTEVDHKDGIKTNNTLSNLRNGSHSKNMQNIKKPRCDNTSGYLGVSLDRKKWVARIRVDGKYLYFGGFPTPELAYDAYLQAKKKHHPFQTLVTVNPTLCRKPFSMAIQ